MLEQFVTGVFKGLGSLYSLDLSCNYIYTVRNDDFAGLHSVQVVNLTRNILDQTYFNSLLSLRKLLFFYSDRLQFCCLLRPEIVCFPAPHFYLCQGLLSSVAQRYLVVVISAFITFLNGLALIMRYGVTYNRFDNILKVYLSIIGCLDGIYFIILWTADIRFGKMYIAVDVIWRSSLICKFAECISFFTAWCRLLIIFIISWEQFRDIVLVFRVSPWKTTTKNIVVITLGFAILGMAVGLRALIYQSDRYPFIVYRSLCLSNNRCAYSYKGIQYVFFASIILVWITFFVTYVGIWLALETSRKKSGRRSSISINDKMIFPILCSLIMITSALLEVMMQHGTYIGYRGLHWAILLSISVSVTIDTHLFQLNNSNLRVLMAKISVCCYIVATKSPQK